METFPTHWQLRSPVSFRLPYERVKLVLDILLASLTLIVLLPLCLLVALAIRLDSRGSILYAQERVGLDRRRRPGPSSYGSDRRKQRGFGRPFMIYKFRSIRSDAEKGTGPVWAAKEDPRATRVGAFLRRSHLDELPQLINVLRGEMSMVGPRPERPQLFGSLVAEIPEYALRCRALPGITGIAQIKNGYDLSLQTAARKVQYDLYYIRHGGVLFDVKIMAATALVLVNGKEGD